jgi:hypothetical protein
MPRLTPSLAGPRRGLATLVVVMVLFFILALTAAYTNRNLIFEQKTSSNQYRSTQAFEAAEAGLEWALAQLNGGLVNASCQPDGGGFSFRGRYLGTIDADGSINSPARRSDDSAELMPACIFDGSNWRCNCPDDAPALPAFTGNDSKPAFRVQFTRSDLEPDTFKPRPGVVKITAYGFTRCASDCFDPTPKPPAGEAMAAVSTLVALRSGLATPPGAALTVQGNVSNAGGGPLAVVNTDPGTNGTTAMIGGNPPGLGTIAPQSLPGTPGERSIVAPDASLAALTDADRMFNSVFGIGSTLWRQQPAAVVVPCASACNAATVQTQVDQHPGSVIWVEGDLSVDGSIGSVIAPALLVVSGQATLATGGVVNGLLYGRTATWDLGTGNGQALGAVVAQGDLTVSGLQTITYDPTILNLLRTRSGSFVRVPGSWQDFRQ